jgi:hypothetical protein
VVLALTDLVAVEVVAIFLLVGVAMVWLFLPTPAALEILAQSQETLFTLTALLDLATKSIHLPPAPVLFYGHKITCKHYCHNC